MKTIWDRKMKTFNKSIKDVSLHGFLVTLLHKHLQNRSLSPAKHRCYGTSELGSNSAFGSRIIPFILRAATRAPLGSARKKPVASLDTLSLCSDFLSQRFGSPAK